jgi:hypothetical protein
VIAGDFTSPARAVGVALAAALVMASAPARADVVELRSGERIEGKLQQATPAFVAIETNGRIVTYPTDQVLAIRFGTAPPAAAAGAGTDGATAPSRPPAPAGPSTPAAPSTPVGPSARAGTTRSPEAREALAALQEFREFLGGGVTYAEYSARLTDVRKKVERVPRGGLAPMDGVPALENALRYYTVARAAWDQSRQNPAGQIDDGTLADLRKEPCGALRSLNSRDRAAVLSAAWICAADAAEDAARALR